MKKIILLLMVLLLATTSCSKGGSSKAYKVGTYALTTDAKLNNATADKEGSAQFTIVLTTVLLEGDVIKQVHIDAAQNAANITKDGQIKLPTTTPTKHEKKDAYNMKDKSPIKKEWYEQMNAFCDYLVGKKVDEVKALKLDDKGKLADVASTTTIGLTDYVAALNKAIELAVEVKGDVAKIGASSTTVLKEGKSFDGKPIIQFDTDFSHVLLDKDGKVLHAYVDVMQNDVQYTDKGEFSNPTKKESKEVLKDEYKMKEKSAIKKEWYEQAQAYTNSLVGKTADDIKKAELKDGKATGDLASSVTITVTGLQASVLKSIESAVELPKTK